MNVHANETGLLIRAIIEHSIKERSRQRLAFNSPCRGGQTWRRSLGCYWFELSVRALHNVTGSNGKCVGEDGWWFVDGHGVPMPRVL